MPPVLSALENTTFPFDFYFLFFKYSVSFNKHNFSDAYCEVNKVETLFSHSFCTGKKEGENTYGTI